MIKYVPLKLLPILILVLAPVGAYFINLEIQSYYGRQAYMATGLERLSLADAKRKARKEGKLVLVDVSAEWCGTCRKLDKEVLSDPMVRKAITENYTFTRLEYESPEGSKFLRAQNVNSYPSLWLVKPNGDVVKRLHVTFMPSEFIKQLDPSRY